jgi:hypothetical protein
LGIAGRRPRCGSPDVGRRALPRRRDSIFSFAVTLRQIVQAFATTSSES